MSKKTFLKVGDKFSLPELEEKVLEFWRTDKIFEKSLAKNAKGKEFVFYEGPPTANGRPGFHHILARSFKDVILRFKAMAGFYVPRRAGWDTHGLPVELEVERKLGLRSKREIEKYGIAAFNRECRNSVWLYKDEWEKLTERMGFWLDMQNPYITYENSYIESVWNILKTVWDKKRLYKGHKVVPWCPRCGTGLSSHELALGYREVTDTSVYIKFKLKPGQTIRHWKNGNNSYILSWTTTPWTLPGNVALAVGRKIQYVATEKDGAELWYAKDSPLAKELGNIGKEVLGEDLIGLEYEPLFDVPALKSKTSYKVYNAKFVTTTDGTGVVHTAVMYGEDDYNLGKEVGLPQVHTVDEQGRFTKDVRGFEGMFVKSPETEKKLLDYLRVNGRLLKVESYTHEYPFCWRCDTPLIYYARDSWFIAMSKLRAKLLAANSKVNWVPENVKEGRFGEWLREVKDWAISRERYWGTPLPIWVCDKCGHKKFIGSIAELEDGRKKSSNRYILVRHGEAENNLENIIDHVAEKSRSNLTLKGRTQAEKLAKKLVKEKIDVIFTSDFPRTKQTAEIIAAGMGIKRINPDKRLREADFGDLNGHSPSEYHTLYPDDMEKFVKPVANGESLNDLRKRLFDFVSEKEKEFSGKTILVVSHEYPIWIFASVLEGWGNREAVEEKHRRGSDFITYAEAQEYHFHNLPRNENGEMDVHRPYLDDVKFACEKCGGKMERIKEVVDVWFDSGAMPFAQAHYPFELAPRTNADLTRKGAEVYGKIPRESASIQRGSAAGFEYPADYISEALDQTRGWFYTLLAIGVLMGKTSPYKNVICLGLILDRNGQKMSKSKGNVVDPWEAIRKYGIDAIRWYFYTVNPPGEPKRFDEVEFTKTSRQFFSLLYNSLVFFDTYGVKNSKFQIQNSKSPNVLDRWILGRLNETIDSVTKRLGDYDIGEAGRALENFVGDLSRWYIRRSRRRFQRAEDKKDYDNASNVLGYVLLETSKLIAPFAPFFGEALYLSLNGESGIKNKGKRSSNSSFIIPNSVHLADWPRADKKFVDKELSAAMDEIRNIASAILAKRAEVGIKVRQPLRELRIKNKELGKDKELLNILKDEVNVKEIKFDAKLEMDFKLDTTITHELKEEGILRELVRTVQDLRQDARMKPQDTIELFIDGAGEIKFIVSKYGDLLKKEVKANRVELGRPPRFDAEFETRIDEMSVWVGIRKQSNVRE